MGSKRSPVTRQLRNPLGGWLAVSAALALLPILIGSGPSSLLFYQQALITFLAVLGLNLQFGYGGELAIAQPVIAGVAAYTSASLTTSLGWSPLATLPICIVVALVTAFVVNLVGFRAKGWYLAATTFFAVLVFPNLVETFTTWTGGDNGLLGIAPLPGMNDGLGGTSLRQYEVLVVLAMAVFLASIALIESRWGDLVRALRDCPNGMSSCGMSPNRVRISLIIVATVPVALSGWVMAHFTGVLESSDFGLTQLLLLIGAVMIGGRGTLWGPIVGTAIFEFIIYFVGPYSSTNQLILGASLLVIGAVFPAGVCGSAAMLWERVRKRADAQGTAVVERATELSPIVANGSGDQVVGGELTREQREVLTAKAVSHRFDGIVALEDVDIRLLASQVVGLVGPNGSGKTTLLNVLTGYLAPNSGVIALDGTEIQRPTPASVALAGVRRSFQTPQLVHELTLWDNLALGITGSNAQHILSNMVRGPSYRRSTREIERRIQSVGSLLGFTWKELATRADELSLGHQRIAEVARALIGNPRVICLDEPAAGLDDSDLELLAEALSRASSYGVAVLLIEHNLNFVRKVSDIMVGLESGKVVSVDELRREGGFDVSEVIGPETVQEVAIEASIHEDGIRAPAVASVDAKSRTDVASGRAALISVTNLSAWYGKGRALSDVSFTVGNGEIIGILGPNGAGKTTLLHSLSGLHRRIEGRVEFDGEDITSWSSTRRVVHGLSLVREGAQVFSDLTVSEHLALSRKLCEQRTEEWQDEDLLFEWLPVLSKLRDTKAAALSGGQKQLLAIASAAMARPRCLLLDEPSAGLAEATLESVFEHVRRIADSGMTLLIAEQSPRYIEDLVDNFLWLDLGARVSPEDQGRGLIAHDPARVATPK